MRMRIKSVKELPEWFDINKYKMTEEQMCDLLLWHDLLAQRNYLNDFSMEIKFDEDLWLNIRKDPLFVLDEGVESDIVGCVKCYSNKMIRSQAVHPISYRRIYQIENRLKSDVKKRIRKWFDSAFSRNISVNKIKKDAKWANSFIDDSVFDVSVEFLDEDDAFKNYQRQIDLVEIDTTLPDALLIEYFKDYLKDMRESYGVLAKPKIKKNLPVEKFYEYKVLAYIDLMLWAKETEVTIPYRVMADAIYQDDDEKGEETIRKTTGKMAKEVLDYDYIKLIQVIAIQENVEENKKEYFRKK